MGISIILYITQLCKYFTDIRFRAQDAIVYFIIGQSKFLEVKLLLSTNTQTCLDFPLRLHHIWLTVCKCTKKKDYALTTSQDKHTEKKLSAFHKTQHTCWVNTHLEERVLEACAERVFSIRTVWVPDNWKELKNL